MKYHYQTKIKRLIFSINYSVFGLILALALLYSIK